MGFFFFFFKDCVFVNNHREIILEDKRIGHGNNAMVEIDIVGWINTACLLRNLTVI